jgi:CheY-like chemotaxis protein
MPPIHEGLQILIVEDNYLAAIALSQSVQQYGAAVVGPAATVQNALALADEHGDQLSGASLDVNLAGQFVFPVADELIARGIPIVFSSGYDSSVIPEKYRDIPLFLKPIDTHTVARELLERATQFHGQQQRGRECR